MRALICLFIFTLTSLEATYVNNPSSTSLLQTGLFSRYNYLINITSGYVADITWDRKIEPVDQPEFVSLEKVDEFEVQSNWATLSLILLRRLEFYAYLGVSKEKMDWTNKPNFEGGSDVKTRNHFSYAVGTRLALLRFSLIGLGVTFQYFAMPTSNDIIQKIKNINLPFDVSDQHLELEEWQTGLGFSAFLGPFTPYVGTKYTKMRLEVETDDNFPTLKFDNRYNWGLFVGSALNFSCNFFCNFEARFFDEYGIGASATAAF